MAKKSTKKKSTRRSEPEDEPGLLARFAGAVANSMAARVVGIAALVGAAAGAALGYGPLVRHVGELRSTLVAVEFEWPGFSGSRDGATWMVPEEQARLEDIVSRTVSVDPFNGASLETAREALLAEGWFDSIEEVRRVPGNRVIVTCTWRAPAAVVRYKGRDLLVARGGELLPIQYGASEEHPLRFIRGAWAGPPRGPDGPGYGLPWAGGDVQAAIDLLVLLRRSSAWGAVGGIDVSRFQNDGHLSVILTSHHGSAELEWGASVGARAPGEALDDEKLRRLENQLDHPGWISAGRPRVQLYTHQVQWNQAARGG